MDLQAIESLMCELAIPRNPANVAAVIRFVQRTEGSEQCFRDRRPTCDQLDCAWRGPCRANAAEAGTQRTAAPSFRRPPVWSTIGVLECQEV